MEDKTPRWHNKVRNIKIDRRKLARRAERVEKVTQRHAHRFIVRRIDNARMVSREIITWLVVVGLMIGGLGLQLLWNQHGYVAEGRESGGAYVEGVIGPLDTLNPLYITSSATASISRLVFSSLYDYDSTGHLRQDVASSMTVSSDGRTHSVTIREDVKWHDGELLTVDDVVFTISMIRNEAVRSPLRVNWLDVTVEKKDNRTVAFTLPSSYAAFPHALTFPILPQHLLKDIAPAVIRESTYSKAPVGSGPFVFRRFQAADALSKHKVVNLVANKDYYRGAPKLARFEMHVFDDETSLASAVKAGDLSGTGDLSASSIDNLSARYKVTPAALNSGVYAIFNTKSTLLQDKDIRKALQVGTNTAAIRAQLNNAALPLDLPILPSQLTGVDIPKAPAYNLLQAGAKLDEAGWKIVDSSNIRKKGTETLTLTITTTKGSEYEKVAKLLQEQWKAFGVDAKLRIVDSGSASSVFVQDTLQARNFDVLLYKLALGADPDVYAYWHSSQVGQTGYNFASYSNSLVDANLASARARITPELRSVKYAAFSKQWLNDAPAVALYQSTVEYISNRNVSAVDPAARLVTAADRYENVLYWTVGPLDVYKTP